MTERTLQETKAFPGRVIFDHLPKTAGQAINNWLAKSLGSGCVTTNLVGEHAALVRQYGGRYSIISAHVIFRHGEQLDPRYQYITLLREPLDRAISWIYFLINNVPEDSETRPLIEGARKFLESEGEEATPEFFDSVRSPYVEHFSRVAGHPSDNDQTKLACALAAISRYEVVGMYEHMSEFMRDVARLVGIEPLERLGKVNVTSRRPKATEISQTLRERLVELNRLDLEFYDHLSEFRQQRSVHEPATPAQPLPGWRKFDEPMPRVLNTPDVSVAFISLQNGTRVRHGVAMTFDIEFLLTRPIEDLEITLSLMDEHDSCAFSINSTQIGTPLLNAETGSYRLSFKVAAILPEGNYFAGFSFTERLPGHLNELFWQDHACEFRVYRDVPIPHMGYMYLPSELSISRVGSVQDDIVVQHPQGSISTDIATLEIASGKRTCVPVHIWNESDSVWIGDKFRPVKIAYHWRRDSGEIAVFDGSRSSLPDGGIPPRTQISADAWIEAPELPGRYILELTMLQEGIYWFEERGFRTGYVEVTVTSAE
ncbi:hypothetical protein DF042_00870 [Burkholderia cenocepacia]|nr:hypothetical protein DF042_00870 [Burkholderia cenocepacia]